MDTDSEQPVRVTVDTGEPSDWTVDPGVFGRFAEHLGGGIYPGVFEDYVVNGSFDVWNRSGTTTGHAFPDVEAHDGVAYPWEPIVTDGEVDFEQRTGGVRGRRDGEALVNGTEIPDGHRLDPPGVTESRYQRVVLDGNGGVKQRIVLPDRRERSYSVRASVRGTLSECVLGVEPATDGSRPTACEAVPVGDQWDRHEVQLTLDEESPERYGSTPYGEYYLTVTGDGAGILDVDWVTVVPDDAVDGKFNPATIRRLRESNVTTLRWPGGNYASQYRWRHGVGPVRDRPVTPVVNWGGLDQNYLGTNEWLRFCELVGAKPYITVPVWVATDPSDAAAWVEYCNGSTDTEMGALRAEHGHPDPWDVTLWGIGNEVWGPWEIGRTDATDYAERYEAYYDAMSAVDPDIEIDACGIDPWFSLVHDGTREDVKLPPDGGDPPVWNERLFEVAAESVDGLDIHRYTGGISSHTSEPDARAAWLEATGETPLDYVELLVNDPGVWDDLFEELRSLAADHGVEDLRITMGEWGLRPDEIEEGWPRASRDTMAHATFVGRALQSILRNGRDVELAHWTDFSQYVYPRPGGTSPDHPGAEIFREVATTVVEGERDFHLFETEVDGSPTRPRPATGVAIPESEPVELVDAVTVGTTGPNGRSTTIVVNGSLTRPVDVAVDYGNTVGTVHGRLYRAQNGEPFATGDDWNDHGHETEQVERDSAATIELALPPASVALLERTS